MLWSLGIWLSRWGLRQGHPRPDNCRPNEAVNLSIRPFGGAPVSAPEDAAAAQDSLAGGEQLAHRVELFGVEVAA